MVWVGGNLYAAVVGTVIIALGAIHFIIKKDPALPRKKEDIARQPSADFLDADFDQKPEGMQSMEEKDRLARQQEFEEFGAAYDSVYGKTVSDDDDDSAEDDSPSMLSEDSGSTYISDVDSRVPKEEEVYQEDPYFDSENRYDDSSVV